MDMYAFETENYHVTPLKDYYILKGEQKKTTAYNTSIYLAGIVSKAEHKIARNGNKYGNMELIDKNGTASFGLFREDYLRWKHFISVGTALYMQGSFYKRNGEELAFKFSNIMLLEDVKKTLTSKIVFNIAPPNINNKLLTFLNQFSKTNSGKTKLSFQLNDTQNGWKVKLTQDEKKGIEFNDELLEFLLSEKKIKWKVLV